MRTNLFDFNENRVFFSDTIFTACVYLSRFVSIRLFFTSYFVVYFLTSDEFTELVNHLRNGCLRNKSEITLNSICDLFRFFCVFVVYVCGMHTKTQLMALRHETILCLLCCVLESHFSIFCYTKSVLQVYASTLLHLPLQSCLISLFIFFFLLSSRS